LDGQASVVQASRHPTNQLRVWVLRRRRNCSYALICTSFDFLVYGALIHRDCFIIYLLSVFFLQSVERWKKERRKITNAIEANESIDRCVYIDISIAKCVECPKKKKRK